MGTSGRLWQAALPFAVPRRLRTRVCCALLVLIAFQIQLSAFAFTRSIAKPLPSHPGNIFVTGEKVSIPLANGTNAEWHLSDYEGRALRAVRAESGRAELGPLPAGYYELTTGQGSNTFRVSLGVIEPLRAPTPMDSPVCIDVGMAWFFPKQEPMEQVANLCVLAGMNRVRDRLMWEQMEPRRGEFVSSNQYDLSADVQRKAGLQVLQVSHVSASWANPVVKRFPPDLRDVYEFCRAMAKRWPGKVVAFEPWNEADIKEFGGHTGSEMATLQKAAYLGLKDGNPNIIGCLNVFAIRRVATLKDFGRNEAYPYFDTFDLHHYEPLQNYPSLYSDFRAISAGKPLWVTECSVHIKWSGDERLKELSAEDARLQSERLTKTYVLSFYQGAAATFYFVLPHYTERMLQYGILRSDLTPRPAYVAAAAVGRLLAGAKPRGRIELPDKKGQAYCFAAAPDGKESDVLVLWGKEPVGFELPAKPRGCFDHLGRPVKLKANRVQVGPAPVYVLFKRNALGHLIPPPKPAKLLEGKPGRIVLQGLLPDADTILEKSAYRIMSGKAKTFSLYAYNFGTSKMRGSISVQTPTGWRARVGPEVEVEPGGRQELPFELDVSDKPGAEQEVRVTGDFGPGEHPVLSMQFVAE